MDFFSVEGKTYLALVDRYTGWLSVLCLTKDDSANVIAALRDYFARWGVAKQLTSDGAKVFTSAQCKDFFDRWGVKHRVSSAYYPRANKRSEVAVKSAKRLIMENIGSKGQLNTDRFARAILLHRNTPDPLTGLSPAMILFGRQIRDHIPAVLGKYKPRSEWRLEADLREQAYAKRHAQMEDRLNFGAKTLPPLKIGDTVTVQDQSNPLKAGKWKKTGQVVEILPHDSYMVVIHGSRAPTQRNRKFLRKISPFHPMIPVSVGEYLPPLKQAMPDPHPVHNLPTPGHHVQQPAPAIPAPAEQITVPPAAQQLPAAVPAAHLPAPAHLPAHNPNASAHRIPPVAAPGQNIIHLLRQREAHGHVQSAHQDQQPNY